ncbi:hypothetical protein I546_0415 [Mycobacterium kansasii 732]|nr:hypothetical protein I546_0415 [Mycobacterium kansasii 732]
MALVGGMRRRWHRPLTGGSQKPSTLLDSGKVSLLRHRRRQDQWECPVTTE